VAARAGTAGRDIHLGSADRGARAISPEDCGKEMLRYLTLILIILYQEYLPVGDFLHQACEGRGKRILGR
jgi:hypothetical protein